MPEAGTVNVAFLDSGHWSACFGLSMLDLQMYDQAGPRRMMRPGGQRLRALTGTGQVPANRNKAVRQFLDTCDGEWLWFIDTDMGFEPDTVERLLAASDPVDRPVLGALCFAGINPQPPRDSEGRPTRRFGYAERYRIQPTVYLWTDQDDDKGIVPILDYPRDSVVECSATGAACLLIHRDALGKIRAQYGDVWFDPITHPRAQDGGPRTFSEDISFCVRLAACDIPLHVDTSVRTTHEKGFVFLDEETFDRQQTLYLLEQEIESLSAPGT